MTFLTQCGIYLHSCVFQKAQIAFTLYLKGSFSFDTSWKTQIVLKGEWPYFYTYAPFTPTKHVLKWKTDTENWTSDSHTGFKIMTFNHSVNLQET